MSEDNTGSNDLSPSEDEINQRIMVMMRQVLSAVARETVPPAGMKHPLSDDTIQGIRDCLSVISARERELNIKMGEESEQRPRYVDEPKTSQAVSIDSITKK